MRQIHTDEEFHLLRAVGHGLIYNDFARHGPSGVLYNVLHAATCVYLGQATLSIPRYIFADLAEARRWLEANRGAENAHWKRCGACQANP
jgi:ABC-type tungstate transport system substrate-binding protein